MPITVHVDPSLRVRYAAASGVVTDADVLEGYGEVLADPAYDPSIDQLFDGSAIERLEVTPAAVMRLAELVARADRAIAPGVRPRVAIVAPADAAFGLARMYEAYRESQQSPKQYFVCRTAEDARRWLGIPDPPSRDAEGRASPAIQFRDADGALWTVRRRTLGFGNLVRLDFESDSGERRRSDVIPLDEQAWDDVNRLSWQSLLRDARPV
jgi:hypothetical protein